MPHVTDDQKIPKPLHNALKKASWIWLEHQLDLSEVYARFRRAFTLDKLPRKCEMHISADFRYRLMINTKEVAFGPARSFASSQCIDRHDLTPYLKKGRNQIAVLVYQPGYSTFENIFQGSAGLLAMLFVDGRNLLNSDASWKASRDDSHSNQVPRLSIYRCGCEDRDLKLSEDWTRPGFRDKDWLAASEVSKPGTAPWTSHEERPVPATLPQDHPCTLQDQRVGPHLPNTNAHRELIAALEKSKELKASTSILAQGKTRLTMARLSWSHSMSGSLAMEIKNAKGDETLWISHLELDPQAPWKLSNPNDYCRMNMSDRYHLRPGRNRIEAHVPRGGSQAIVAFMAPKGRKLEYRARFRQYRLDLKETSVSNTLPSRLQRISRMCSDTFRACTPDALVDCPWREQAQWTGDGAISGRIAAMNFSDIRPLRSLINSAARGQYPDAHLPGVSPSQAHAYTIPAYSFSWIESLLLEHELSRDRTWTRSHWSTLMAILDSLGQLEDTSGMLKQAAGRRAFIDWAELDEKESHSVYQCRYLYALQCANTLATKLSLKKDRLSLEKRIKDFSTRLVRHLKLKSSQPKVHSQHLAAFLVLTKLVDNDKAGAWLNTCVACSLDRDRTGMVLASPYMHYYLFLALDLQGRRMDIHDIVAYRWGRWLDMGMSTCPENWNLDFPDASRCHAWSAHPILFLI